MTLIYHEPREGPGTHALVIGVGGYDHLHGGISARKLRRATSYGNLGQLTSPPKSACALARFLTTSDPMDWAAPLATVDLLVSTAPSDEDPGGEGGPYQRATRGAIVAAFDDWWDRCDTHPENVAVFYFCGHGMQATNQVLLASDFGSTGDPWSQAFDLNKTRQAFTANRARTQVFLIDACREVNTAAVEGADGNVLGLRGPKKRQREGCEHDLTIQATSRTQKAHGKEGEVSYFTEAVLHALDGGAAKKQNGVWLVTTDRIAGQIGQMVELAGGAEQRPTINSSTATWLRRLKFTPEVQLEFGCDPEEATEVAELTYGLIRCDAPTPRPRRDPAPWRVMVPAAIYQIAARFPEHAFVDAEEDIAVEPPIVIERLAVR